MGYRLNRLDEPFFMAVPKPMLTEFGIHHRFESCALVTVSTPVSVDLLQSRRYSESRFLDPSWNFFPLSPVTSSPTLIKAKALEKFTLDPQRRCFGYVYFWKGVWDNSVLKAIMISFGAVDKNTCVSHVCVSKEF